MNGIYKQ